MTGATCQDFVRNWTRGTEEKTFTKSAVSFKNQLIIKSRFGSTKGGEGRGRRGIEREAKKLESHKGNGLKRPFQCFLEFPRLLTYYSRIVSII